MSQPATAWDPTKYDIYGMYAAGLRFVDDYDEDAAVRLYLKTHPDAVEVDVRAELAAEIQKRA